MATYVLGGAPLELLCQVRLGTHRLGEYHQARRPAIEPMHDGPRDDAVGLASS